MLVQYLNKYDKNWRSTNGGHPIIILHACATSDFAKEMSNDEEFKDAHLLLQMQLYSHQNMEMRK